MKLFDIYIFLQVLFHFVFICVAIGVTIFEMIR